MARNYGLMPLTKAVFPSEAVNGDRRRAGALLLRRPETTDNPGGDGAPL